MKKKKFKEISINIEEKLNKYIAFEKTILNNIPYTLQSNIETLPDISYFIISYLKGYSIYNKQTYELIQNINYDSCKYCYIFNENAFIIRNSSYLCELWTKEDKQNIFTKKMNLFRSFSNIIVNSKGYIFYYGNANTNGYFYHIDEDEQKIQIWDTKNNIPQNLINGITTSQTNEKQLLLMNNEKILVVNHSYIFNIDTKSISFYSTKNFENIKNLTEDENKTELKIYKLDENRLIIMEYNIYECDNDDQYIQIMKIPEYEIVKEFKPHFPRNKILVYKKYFFFVFSLYFSDI